MPKKTKTKKKVKKTKKIKKKMVAKKKPIKKPIKKAAPKKVVIKIGGKKVADKAKGRVEKLSVYSGANWSLEKDGVNIYLRSATGFYPVPTAAATKELEIVIKEK